MNILKIIYFALILIYIPSAYTETKPQIIIVSDFDGTITNPFGEGKYWRSPIGLDQISTYPEGAHQAIHATLSPFKKTFDDLPLSIEITQEESLFLKQRFYNGSVSNYQTILLSALPGLKNREKEQVIIPGIYQFQYKEVFSSNEVLIANYQEARDRAKEQNFPIKDIFQLGFDLINNNITKDNVRVLVATVRGQSPKTFAKLFQRIQKDGVLFGDRKDLKKIQYYPMSRPEGSLFGPILFSRKIELLEKEIKMLEASVKQYPSQEIHLVFAEDHVQTQQLAQELFIKQSKDSHFAKVYLHILFLGPETYLEKKANERLITYHKGNSTVISSEHAEKLGLSLKYISDEINKITKLSQPSCKQFFSKRK